MDRAQIQAEWDKFIEYPSDDKRIVTTTSALLFAEHIAKLQATQELVQAGSASLLDGCKSIMDSIAVSSSVIEHNRREPVQAGELPDERPVRVNRGTLSIARDAIEYEKGNAHKQGYKQGYQQGKEDERQRALSARKPTDAWQDVSACPDGDVWFSLSCGHVVMGYKHGAIFDWEANIDHDCCGDATATKAMPVTPPDSYGIGLEVKHG